MWVGLMLVGLGLLMTVLASGREHDVFGDGVLSLSEGQLMQAITVGGPRRPAPPPSELDLAILQFLGNQADSVVDADSQAASQSDEKTPYDFCPT